MFSLTVILEKNVFRNQKQITNFISLIHYGSINRAAENLYISPQALHQELNRMESELGIKLVTRNKRGIKLTSAGEIFYQGIKKINTEYEKLVIRTKQAAEYKKIKTKITTLSSGIFHDYILLDAIRSFKKLHPNIELIYKIPDQNLQDPDLILNDIPDIKSKRKCMLGQTSLYSGVNGNHPLAKKKLITQKDLFKFPIVMPSQNLCKSLLPDFYNNLTKNSQVTFINNQLDEVSLLENSSHSIVISYGPSRSSEKVIPIENTDFPIELFVTKKPSAIVKTYLNFIVNYHQNHKLK